MGCTVSGKEYLGQSCGVWVRAVRCVSGPWGVGQGRGVWVRAVGCESRLWGVCQGPVVSIRAVANVSTMSLSQRPPGGSAYLSSQATCFCPHPPPGGGWLLYPRCSASQLLGGTVLNPPHSLGKGLCESCDSAHSLAECKGQNVKPAVTYVRVPGMQGWKGREGRERGVDYNLRRKSEHRIFGVLYFYKQGN